jgi:dephospho-CoA kinase
MRVIAFAGPLGSGKSEVAKRLAELLGVQCVSFGDVVRQEASRRRIPTDRQSLAKLGRDMIEEEGEARLFDRLLGVIDTADVAVVDGVRSVAMAEAIRNRAALELFYLTADTSTRLDRVKRRQRAGDIETAAQLEASDRDPLELGARDVEAVADRVIDTTDMTSQDVLRKVLDTVRHL